MTEVNLNNPGEGLVNLINYNIKTVELKMEELLRHQMIMIDSVEIENSKFNENTEFQEVQELMLKTQSSYLKLKCLKKDMNNLRERSLTLKKRSLKLEQYRKKILDEKISQKNKQDEQRNKLLVKFSKSGK